MAANRRPPAVVLTARMREVTAEALRKKCEKLGVSPSDVMRAGVNAFITGTLPVAAEDRLP